MATSKREKTAVIFNTFSSNFILVVLANLFSSHHSRVELLGTVLTPFHFDVWLYESGLKWVEPYKSESSRYGDGVWEEGEWKSFLKLSINRCIMRKVEIQLLHSEQSKTYLQIIFFDQLSVEFAIYFLFMLHSRFT